MKDSSMARLAGHNVFIPREKRHARRRIYKGQYILYDSLTPTLNIHHSRAVTTSFPVSFQTNSVTLYPVKNRLFFRRSEILNMTKIKAKRSKQTVLSSTLTGVSEGEHLAVNTLLGMLKPEIRQGKNIPKINRLPRWFVNCII